jgi:hypothetical protein
LATYTRLGAYIRTQYRGLPTGARCTVIAIVTVTVTVTVIVAVIAIAVVIVIVIVIVIAVAVVIVIAVVVVITITIVTTITISNSQCCELMSMSITQVTWSSILILMSNTHEFSWHLTVLEAQPVLA